MSWRARWRAREYVRNSIWIVPAVFAAAAYALGRVQPSAAADADFPVQYGAEAARALLGALASGMIAFTGFVFSILLLSVQFGSSQYSPRMLRRFLRDGTTKAALGTFIATFLYALLVLRYVGTAADPGRVPNIAISLAIVLLLASMLMFLRLIHTTTSRMRIAAVLRSLAADARAAIDRAYPAPAPDDGAAEALPPPPGPAATVEYTGAPSTLQSIDRRGLVRLAARNGWTIELVPAVGDLLVDGDPLFRVHGADGALPERRLRAAAAAGDERTLRQDPAFAFRLLADIAAKALSPGVNDPSSATQALDQLEALLRQLGRRRLGPGVLRDADGAERLRWPVPTWEDYLSLALDEARHYGEGSVQVSRRLRALLLRVGERVPPYRRPAVEAKLALVGAGAARAFHDEPDRAAAATGDLQGIGPSQRG